MAEKSFVISWLVMFMLVLVWSAWHPADTLIWWLEVFPALIGVMVLAITMKSFPLTRLLYGLILIHMIILMVGGHYTYAQMPLFDVFKEMFGWSRNYYDRVGHVAQGFVPAMIAREVLIRKVVVNGAGWLFFVVTCICLAISAMYELLEWWVAAITGEAADAFLATQGDVWDTQWDMFLALLGAMAAQWLLGATHDRAIRGLKS